MKALGIAATIAGAIGSAVGIYGNVETAPNYDATRARNMDSGGVSSMVELAYEESLIETMFMQTISTWVLGLVAVVLGVIAVRKGAKLGWAGLVLGLVGAGLGAMLIR